MEIEKQANQLNEQRNAPAELADLPVTAEQAQQIAAGTDVIVSAGPGANGHVKVFDGSTGRVGDVAPSSNHNETTVSDGEADGQVYFADLPVADEQAEKTKGGPTTNVEVAIRVIDTENSPVKPVLPILSSRGNHNETTVSDELEEAAEEFSRFADLPLSSAQSGEINGGYEGQTIRLRIAATNNQGKL